MKFLKLLLISGLVWLGTSSVQAQDIHFSQFYLSPINLNPAMTGVMNCNGRFVVNYRNQWSSVLSDPYSTFAGSYDARVPVGRDDFFGWGVSMYADKAGTSEFGRVLGRFSGSYSKKMGGYRKRAHYLVAGGELGIGQQSINFLALRFGSQFDGETYNAALPSGETFARESFLYPDIAGGIMWFTVFDENNNFFVGGAFNHLNAPNVSFFEDANIELSSRATVHAGGEFMLNRSFGLVPGVVLLRQGPHFETNFGTSAKFLLGRRSQDYQAFQLGVWGRLARDYQTGIASDAVIISTRFDYNDFTLGFSYDVNISQLSTASNGNGGFELALIYQICNGFKRDVYCPRF